ncbi:MAG TPA: DUF1841 family protein [Steroidobacteraceae bacterium]|nr:DUF1841 family protein [Steroidobacteraceae bacterium]
MFAPSRDQARLFFFDTWAKYRRGEPLSGLEQTALAVIFLHPEYHSLLLQGAERNLDREYQPDAGNLNPFLHLSLHLAAAEQLSIDQPPGIAQRYRALLQRLQSEHDALHAVIECLGETIWQAQRSGTAPDAQAYLECLDRRVGGRP